MMVLPKSLLWMILVAHTSQVTARRNCRRLLIFRKMRQGWRDAQRLPKREHEWAAPSGPQPDSLTPAREHVIQTERTATGFINDIPSALPIVASCVALFMASSVAGGDFPPPGWARLADWNAQREECLKVAGRSMAEGMQCKFAQAAELPPLERQYREWFGEEYDPAKYRECLKQAGQPTNFGCEFLRLMREPEPEYWPYPDAPRPKWPEAPNPPVYRKGMTSKQYFDALCRAEAGEFVYKTVDNVEGIYQVRPRRRVSSDAYQDRYVLEDPYGYTDWEAEDPETIFSRGGFARYKFFESVARRKPDSAYGAERFDKSVFAAPPPNARVERYFGYDGRDKTTLRKEFHASPKSRYGFTWRGIKRPRDRELGVAGGELIVVDLVTGEVLGVRRGFAQSGTVRNRTGFNWETALVCPRLRKRPDASDKFGDFSYWFVSKIARPVGN